MPNFTTNYTPTIAQPRPRQPQPGGGPVTGGGGNTGGGGTQSTGGGQTTSTSGGGTYLNFDPRIGNGQLPPNQWGAANRAYVREPRQEEMSSYHLNQIASPNNPLTRNAMTRAAQASAARGGLNTTMAGEAAQKAIIETATPLALQQAGAYGTAASENQAMLNQRDLANLEMENANRQYDASMAAAQLGNEFELQRQRERLAFEGEQSELGRRYGFNMAGLENQFGTQRDLRQNDFATEADWRNYQIQSGLASQGFNYDQMAEQFRFGNQARQDAYRAILDLTVNNPQEMDEYISSGMMEYFNNFANQYFTPAFNRIFGGG